MFALPQSWKVAAGRGHFIKMQNDPRVLPAKALDRKRERSAKHRRRTSDLQFTPFRIGQEIDVLYSLPQFVEGRSAPLEKGASVDRGFDPARIAIKQTHGKHQF